MRTDILAKAKSELDMALNSYANMLYIRSRTANSARAREEAAMSIKAVKHAIAIVDVKLMDLDEATPTTVSE